MERCILSAVIYTDVEYIGIFVVLYGNSGSLCIFVYKDFMVVLISPFWEAMCWCGIFQIIRVPDMVRPDMILIGQVVIKSSGLTLLIAIAISLTIVTLIGAFFCWKNEGGLKKWNYLLKQTGYQDIISVCYMRI